MSYFKRIISLFLVTFFLLGSSGIHIYRSYCNLTGESSLEIFANQDPCDHNDVVDQHIQHSCCQSDSEGSIQSNKCCNEEQIILKVYLPYTVQKLHFLLASPFAFISKKLDFVSTSIAQASNSSRLLKEYPSPPSGKERLFMIASLRI